MNGVEQKSHRVVTQELARAITTVAEGTAQSFEDVRRAIGDERTHRLKLADEQRSYVDARDRELRECCQQRWDAQAETNKRMCDAFYGFTHRGFWSRLNWLLTGR